tara:strand:- start:144 stop:401 length:258 start_codon:yes stop_codon:yes gene_type:complete
MAEKKIYVGNLSYQSTDEDLQEEFSKYGELEDFRLIKDYETGRSKGFAFITFKEEEGAAKAIENDGNEFQGRNIRIRVAEDRKKA